MSDVYKGSLCKIAATASKNSQGGGFRKRDPRLVKAYLITTSYTNRSNHQYLLAAKEYWKILHDHEQPLIRQGWVVQERVPSPRVRHFGSEYVFWECRSQRFGDISSGHNIKCGVRYRKKCLTSWLEGKRSITVRVGQNVTQLYSLCNLTKEEDKLVAVSASAKEVEKILNPSADYVSGLWKSQLSPLLF
jgi:hypothetical protein